MSAAAPTTLAELQEAVTQSERVLAVGGGTKPALSASGDASAVALELGGLDGIVAYDPAELTISARAGTRVAELEAELARNGQCLPFDPLLVEAGSTLGGAVATGVSGPAAFGNGVVRDFVLGATVVDGSGRVVCGGGRVVKNAAGFDLPKLMVGSAGRLAVIAELTCKVFPRPQGRATVAFECGSVAAAAGAAAAIARGPVELEALEAEPPGRLLARLGGAADLLAERAERLRAAVAFPGSVLAAEEEARHWRAAVELEWVPGGSSLVAVALPLADLGPLEAALAVADPPRRYNLGAGLALVAWPAASGGPAEAGGLAEPAGLDPLATILEHLGLTGLALLGPAARSPLIGAASGNELGARVREAIDPGHRFLELWP